jgi:hypothetical protein
MKALKLQFLLLWSLTFCLSDLAHAQLIGYGSGSTNLTLNLTTFYTNDVRAKVQQYSPVSDPWTANLVLNNMNGTFSLGDKVLLHQTKGNNIGTHQAVIITAISGSNLTISSFNYGQFLFSYSTANTNDRLQIMKIKEYENLTLNSGIITCHPWNDVDGSGGILCNLKHFNDQWWTYHYKRKRFYPRGNLCHL